MKISNLKITQFNRINWSRYGFTDRSINDILEDIRKGDLMLYDYQLGNYSLKQITHAIRQEQDVNKQSDWKEKFLPAVTFNGTWDGDKISNYSCYTALDFDHITSTEQKNNTIQSLKQCSCVLAVFSTLKPFRLKAIILHDNQNPALHKDMYNQLINKFGITLLDTSCSDLSRKNYLVWDKDIWINPNPIPFHYAPCQTFPPVCHGASEPLKQAKSKTYSGNKQKSPQSIINILNSSWRKNHPEYWMIGHRAECVFKCACLFCEYGVPLKMAEDYFLNGGWLADDFGENEVIKHVNGAYKYNKGIYGTKEFY